MAWIVKDSAGMKIERRPDPYVSEKMKAHFEGTIIPRYATRRAALLPLLHEIQHEHNWIPFQALEEAAAFLGITTAEALDTASFYEEFHLKPKGRHLIQICQSIGCELCGHKDLLEKVQKKLDILPGETTDDGRFTLMTVECLGSCDTAPVGLMNEDLHEKLTWERLEKVIDSMPSGGGHHHS